MKRLVMVPDGWPCKFSECRPGHFLFMDKYLGFKSEYHTNNKSDAYNEAGEFYCGDRDGLVQPVDPVWEEEDV